MINNDLIVIYNASNSAQAQMLTQELERRGIRGVILDESLQGGAAEIVGMSVDPKVAVAKKDEQQARMVAQAFDQAVLAFARGDRPGAQAASPGARALAEMISRLAISPADEQSWPACSNCGQPRQTACPVCGTVGGDFPRADIEFADAFPPDAEVQFTVLCTTCDDPFVPEWLKLCGTCGNNFGEGTDLLHSEEPVDPYEPINSRIVLVGFLLLGSLLALGVYFMMIGNQ